MTLLALTPIKLSSKDAWVLSSAKTLVAAAQEDSNTAKPWHKSLNGRPTGNSTFLLTQPTPSNDHSCIS